MAKDKDAIELAGVRLTSPDKVLFPDQGVTKRDLARYFLDLADHILPHLVRRPLSLVRCPDGYDGGCFFQKHGMSGFPDSFHKIEIREKDGKLADYLYVEHKEGLVAAAQMGVLELHIWGAHIDTLERPDRLVFDLDPAEDIPFTEVKKAAQTLRNVLFAANLESFALLTGGKGIHVVAPLEPRQDWDTVKRFSTGLARALAAAEPDRFTSKASKTGRKGRIFIDWLRNERGATAIAPYSPRARPGAPVATPIGWRELSRIANANKFTLKTLERRMKALKSEPWKGYFSVRQSIGGEALKLIDNGRF